jgi:CBS domain-containing protein
MNGNRAAATAINTIRIDMHCHSSLSDGSLTPEQVAKNLSDSAVKYAALTDHDTLAGLPAFRHALMHYGIGFISGVEITSLFENYKLHILAYGFDPEYPELSALLNPKIGATEPSATIIPRRLIPAAEVIDLIHEAGGLAILAHPFKTEPDFEKLKILTKEMQELGIDGIEALYGPNSTEEEEKLLALAEERNLIVSAGTDYHAANGDAPGVDLTIERWKIFRDAVLKVSSNNAWKRTSFSPKPLRKPKNLMLSFVFNILMPAVLSLSLFIVALFFILLPYFEKTLLERKRENIRELTQVAWGVLKEATEEVENNQLTVEQAQALAKNRIEAMRYGSDNRDYFWLQDLSPRILMHPYRKDLNGQDVSDFQDKEGTRIFVAFADLVREKGEGYISYVWQWMDDFDRLEPKESYIRLFEPWGWVIGTGIYVQDVQAEIAKFRGHLVKMSLVIIAIVLLLLIYLVRQGLLLEQSQENAERLLHEAVERYRALSEAVTEGALFVYDGRLRYANAVMYELLGCAGDSIELLDIDDIFPDIEENRQWRNRLTNTNNSDPETVGGVLRRCDGTDLYCTLTMRDELHNQNTGFMILVRRSAEDTEHTGTRVALNKLLQLPVSVASDLTGSILQAEEINEIITLCLRTPELTHVLLENGTSSVAVANMISSITDAATQRTIELYIKEAGPPPLPYAFIGLGSHGRKALTLHSDQDNAIIYRLNDDKDAAKAERYFLDMATIVCDTLEQAGYKKCIGGKIASNPKWCKPLSLWKNNFEEWIRNSEPQQVVDFSILFDFRPICGDFEIAVELRNHIDAVLRETPFFLSQIAQNALIFKTPMRLFGTIVTSGGKDHPGRIDVKSPAMAIVSFARLYSLRQNMHETNTLLRLDAIRQAGIVLDSKHRNIVTAYETLLRLRLWNQALAIEQNKKVDNWVDPGQLGRMEEVFLRECFKEIDELQVFIQRDFLA